MEEYMSNDFFGELTYKIDGKIRVVNPVYDENSQDCTVYLLINAKQHEYDRCVLCMNADQFRTHYNKLVKVPKGGPAYELVKHILASVTKVKTDKQGKILIPRHLKEYAGINEKITFRATDEGLEMWSSERLEEKRRHDFSNAAAYKDFERYINNPSVDYNDEETYRHECDRLEREIDLLELTSRRDKLISEKEEE